jgi:hypothetical protein
LEDRSVTHLLSTRSLLFKAPSAASSKSMTRWCFVCVCDVRGRAAHLFKYKNLLHAKELLFAACFNTQRRRQGNCLIVYGLASSSRRQSTLLDNNEQQQQQQ